MRTALITLSSFGFIVLAAIGCSKSSNDHAGKGGNATLTVQLEHHAVARNLTKGIVYIKYDATDVPANGIYDDSATCTSLDTMQKTVFTNLKNGNYFLYATGTDTSIYKPVKGGGAYTITQQGPQTYTLAVSED